MTSLQPPTYKVSAEQKFKIAVRNLHRKGIYPGPTVLNSILHNRHSRNLSGRECRWRRQVMAELGIPLKNPDSQDMMERMYGNTYGDGWYG